MADYQIDEFFHHADVGLFDVTLQERTHAFLSAGIANLCVTGRICGGEQVVAKTVQACGVGEIGQLNLPGKLCCSLARLRVADGAVTADADRLRIGGNRYLGVEHVPVCRDDVSLAIEVKGACSGIKVDLLKAGTSNIVVQRDSNKLSSALSGVAVAYNAVVAEIDQSRGASQSALNGHNILWTVSQALRRLSAEMPDLGFSFSDKGVLSFSSAEFEKHAPADAISLIGSSEGGFLSAANDILDMIDAGSTGLLPSTAASITSQIADTDRQINANQERIDLLRERLAAQMAASDALIGMLEQQVTYMNNLFEAMKADE